MAWHLGAVMTRAPPLTWAFMQVVAAVGACSSLNHVVDVFRGASNAAIRNKHHDALPEHGLGKSMKCVGPLLTPAHVNQDCRNRASSAALSSAAWLSCSWHFRPSSASPACVLSNQCLADRNLQYAAADGPSEAGTVSCTQMLSADTASCSQTLKAQRCAARGMRGASCASCWCWACCRRTPSARTTSTATWLHACWSTATRLLPSCAPPLPAWAAAAVLVLSLQQMQVICTITTGVVAFVF